MTLDLFAPPPADPHPQPIADDAWLLRGFALAEAPLLLDAIASVLREAPLRQLSTPGGRRMSVRTSSCGSLGWVSDARGYRYETCDPESHRPWPAMPETLRQLARSAASTAAYADFTPDSCLINQYAPGAGMGLHQDRDEQDFRAPIVSVSLGLPAVFLFGGDTRSARPTRHRLVHGDVVVWGGRSRLNFHGIAPLAAGQHPVTGAFRYNLTFRKAG